MRLDPNKIDKILVIRLRSIGDSVLSTPTLLALREFFPEAKIDLLLEDWVAPLLENFVAIDKVIRIPRDLKGRLSVANRLRREKYDLVFDLHGGSTAGLLVRATGAKIRVGYNDYRFPYFYTDLLSSSSDFWQRKPTHSAEQQMALAGFLGVPVSSEIKTQITIDEKARQFVEDNVGFDARQIALLHPFAAFDTKTWALDKFVLLTNWLVENGFRVIAVGSTNDNSTLNELRKKADSKIEIHSHLKLQEVAAIASRARIFIGNDSGIAHIAAAVKTPQVVIFGSSNREHWHPWMEGEFATVYEEFSCQPCAGYECKKFGVPKCILAITPEAVIEAVKSVLSKD